MFQILASVVDARVASVDVQRSGYAVRVVGNPDNLKLRKRTGVSGLNVNHVDLAGLVGDVDAGLTCDTSSHDVLRTDRIRGSLRKDLRVDL